MSTFRSEVSCEESERTIVIPLIIGIIVVGVHKRTIVPVRVEHVRVAVGMYIFSSVPPPIDYQISEMNRIRDHNHPKRHTK